MKPFFRVQLRTFDAARAAPFYAAVLGYEPPIIRLHDAAIARGARPHWLGFLAVDDVDAAAAALIAVGASSLGPKWKNPEGLEAAVLRDPGGAVVAVGRYAEDSKSRALNGQPAPHVAWYSLQTADVERVKTNYSELFGFRFFEPLDLGALGPVHPFAFAGGHGPAGVLTDLRDRPDVHPHWLFFFSVPLVASAVEAVRARGGKALAPLRLGDGRQIAICDDPDGAAFAVVQQPSRDSA